MTYFGSSAPFFTACRGKERSPRKRFALSALRGVGSTGAPLPPEGFRWIYDHVKENVCLLSVVEAKGGR